MTFDEWWDSDEAFKTRHDDERTQAQAAWNAAYAANAALITRLGEYLSQAPGPINGELLEAFHEWQFNCAASRVR